MPKPISRRNLLRNLRSFGWDGPYPKGPQMYMTQGKRRITIPNPHGGDIDWSLTKRILDQAGIDRDEWDKLA